MIWLLLVIYQLKHFLADYPLQGRYMLGKFKPFPHFILPLSAHALVHGLFTFVISVWFKPPGFALSLAFADAGIHFLVDLLKANPSIGGRWTALAKHEFATVVGMSQGIMPVPQTAQETLEKQQWAKGALKSNVYFWWALGADQMAHHLTHYAIIWALVS